MKESITSNNNTLKQNLHKSLSVTINRGEGPVKYTFERGALWGNIIAVVKDLYHGQGYTLTLRQLYYQLVAKDLVPNDDKMYKLIGRELSKMRRSGVIDWNAIEDRNRQTSKAYREHSVEGALERTLNSYRLDRQIGQPYHIEVMAEKDAVSNIISPVCNQWSVIYSINRGYLSTSAMYSAYRRFAGALRGGQPIKVLYLGDHDPSGIQMREDIHKRVIEFILCGRCYLSDVYDANEERVDKFFESNTVYFDYAESDEGYEGAAPYVKGHPLSVIRDLGLVFSSEHEAMVAAWVEVEGFEFIDVALSMDQIRRMNLPPNPAKLTDSRAAAYVKQFGNKSWELDAIPPSEMSDLLSNSLEEVLDVEALEAIMALEDSDKEKLQVMIESLGGYEEE